MSPRVKLKKTATLFEGSGALPFDPAHACAHLTGADPIMGGLVARVGALGLQRRTQRSPFESLAESIVYQQLNGRAAETIHNRVLALFPRKRIQPELLLALPDLKLRGAGLSQNKMLALQDLSRKTIAGLVPSWKQLELLDDETIIERLTEVRGIGRWTVQMLLIFRMGRPDVLPVDDFAVRKAFGQLYRVRGEVDRKRLEKHAEKWRPFRSAASWYLWRHLDTAVPD
ncbi:MAG: DNA-3-methyladenine glycosylase family protein [Myxococcaceae bacterium]